jgi:hypothetical protein
MSEAAGTDEEPPDFLQMQSKIVSCPRHAQTVSSDRMMLSRDHAASTPDDEGCIKRKPHTRNLPVVPICRTSPALRCRANQNDALACPAPIRGALRGRHERWSGMRWTRHVIRRMTLQADGEVVWSWRSDAGVKFAKML